MQLKVENNINLNILKNKIMDVSIFHSRAKLFTTPRRQFRYSQNFKINISAVYDSKSWCGFLRSDYDKVTAKQF